MDLFFPLPELDLPAPEDGLFAFGWLQNDPADSPIENGCLPLDGDGGDITKTHHRRDGQRSGENYPMGGACSQICGHHSYDLRIELHRRPRR